jgi:hypothetical protein
MKIATLFAASALVACAGPVMAQAGEINAHARVGAALRQGCAVHQVHTPAGKTVHSAPIVRCDGAKAELAARTARNRSATGGSSAVGMR